MQWITCKKAYALGKEIPLGTKGEGDVPAHLVGKVSVLIVATPQADPEPEGEEEVTETELTEQVETDEVAEADPEPEAEKPTRGGKR